jgi:hypothetical protein
LPKQTNCCSEDPWLALLHPRLRGNVGWKPIKKRQAVAEHYIQHHA